MKKTLLGLALLSGLSGMAQASDQAIQTALQKIGVRDKAEIYPAPLPGLKTVLLNDGMLFITEDGSKIIQGPIYDISSGHAVNVSNRVLLDKMQQMAGDMIVFKAPQERYTVTVFTDITCGYCRKLHSELDGYLKRGITVRYLAFPRAGLNSEVEKNMRAIWCVKDRNKAFTQAMQGQDIAPAECDIDLKRQYQLGLWFGIQGTPAIVLPDGTVLPGYASPDDLLKALQKSQADATTSSS